MYEFCFFFFMCMFVYVISICGSLCYRIVFSCSPRVVVFLLLLAMKARVGERFWMIPFLWSTFSNASHNDNNANNNENDDDEDDDDSNGDGSGGDDDDDDEETGTTLQH